MKDPGKGSLQHLLAASRLARSCRSISLRFLSEVNRMPAWRNLKSRVAIQHTQMVHWKMPVQAARLSFDTTAKMILQEGSRKQGGEFENIVLISSVEEC